MRTRNVVGVVKVAMTVQVLCLAGSVPAAEAPKSRAGQSPTNVLSERNNPEDLELDEILVDGQKPTRDQDKVMKWFVRLTGAFRVEGLVEVQGDSPTMQQVPVRGTAKCFGIGGEQMGFRLAPGVECFLDVAWPQVRGLDSAAAFGGSSTLRPATLLYGYEGAIIGVRHLLIDNKGVAEGGAGLLFGDTVVTTTPCANIEGNCRRRVRITAEPDLKSVRMRIDLQLDGKSAGGYDFVMHRDSAPP